MKITEKIAAFATETPVRRFPREVVHQAKRCFLDLLGVAFGGSTQTLCRVLIKIAKDAGGKPQATVLGHGFQTGVMNAALINGAMAHALDFDDTHIGSIMHPSAPVIPVILAVGEWLGISGKSALEAFVPAYEVETRMGMGMGNKHYDRGWHTTATCGRFGAAIAAGRLLGLTKSQMIRAVGLAGTQASGLRLAFGTMAKPFHPGKSASDGLLAAFLARENFSCAPNMIEGPKGFAEALGDDDTDLNLMVKGLGRKYEILNNTFKPYAACLLTHPAIDGVLDLRNKYNLLPQDIREISCDVARFCLDAAGQLKPATGLAGKFSLSYCAALALSEGAAGEDLFTDEKVRDPQMAALQKKVKSRTIAKFKDTEARVTIITQGGKKYSAYVDKPKGDPRNPLTDQEMEAKFRSLAASVLPRKKIDALVEMIWNLEKVKDLRKLLKLCH